MNLKSRVWNAAGVVLLAFCCGVARGQVISTAAGTFNVSGRAATKVSIWSPSNLVSDTSGNVYFTSNHRVYKINSSGVLTLVAGSGNYGNAGDGGAATSAKLNSIGGLALDSAGNLYIADSMYGVVRKVTVSTGIITTVAGTGVRGFSGDGGAATSAKLNWCMGLALDKYDNLYVADFYNAVVRKVDASTGNISTVAGVGKSLGDSGDGGAATSAKLMMPISVLVDGSGNLYIADYMGMKIRRVDASTGTISTIAGTGVSGYTGDGGLATNARLSEPRGLAGDGSGNLYFADIDYHVIRKVDAATGIITTVAGTGSSGYTGDGGPATSATLAGPSGTVFDASGNMWIADTYNYVLRKVDASTGYVSTVAGNGYNSYSGDGGPATSAQLSMPTGTAMDSDGNLYVADEGNYVIRKVDAKTGSITTYAGNGSHSYTGDGGLATSASIGVPYAIAVDRSNNLYIDDPNHSVIRKVDAKTGLISTIAGTGTDGYTGDGGLATSAKLSYPSGIAVDAAGNLYIADTSNYVVRKVDAATGGISTIAGTGTDGHTGDGGLAASAQLGSVSSVALDGSGNLYILDGFMATVREVSLNPADTANYGLITTIAGGGSTTITSTPSKALESGMISPYGLFADYAGNVFVADLDANSIFKIYGSSFTSPSSGMIVTVAGKGQGTYAYTGDGGLATSAELGGPYGVGGDIYGNLLISDTTNGLIRKVAGLVSTPPESVLSASSLSFGALLQNSSATSAKTLTITNPGTRNLLVASIAVSGTNASDFLQSNTCIGGVVGPGASCTVSLVFQAKAVGSETAALTVTSNALNSPQTVALSGTGIGFTAPSAATGGSTTATVTAGGTATYLLQVKTSGGSASDSLTFALSCAGAPAGATCTLPASVTATTSAPGTFTVSVATTGSSSASLQTGNSSGLVLALLPFGLIGLAVCRKRAKGLGICLLLLVGVVAAATGCGNSSSSAGTPAGTYVLTVQATTSNVTQTTSLTLIVK